MNDLGMTLVWSAIQITLILIPAAVLNALASRRSPASGSWIATVGLALSLAIAAATLIPWSRETMRHLPPRRYPSTLRPISHRHRQAKTRAASTSVTQAMPTIQARSAAAFP